jgi:hypothetical protein
MQNEITEPSKLLNEDGTLVQKGWARKPLLTYNKENIAASWLRIKEWDYYAVLNDTYGITFTFSDLGYIGLIACVWLDFKEKDYISEETLVWFPKGNLGLPKSSEMGDINYSKNGLEIHFKKREELRQLYFKNPEFADGVGIEVNIELKQDPKADSVVIATPWKEKPTRFYYNQKINCMSAKGRVRLGNEKYSFNKNAFGVLDWGRGIWTYKNTWYWGSASGKLNDGTLIGWNLGYGFSDRSYASENIIFYQGVGHKLDKITFEFDSEDYLRPWQITSNEGRFEMKFEPILDRNSKINFLILKSEQHQVFGYYSGYLILDDGSKVQIDNMLGFAEEVYNKW